MDATLLLLDWRNQPRPVCRDVLERAGYRVVQVLSVPEATRRAREDEPSLVVLEGAGDLSATIRDIRRLRRDPATAHTPILVLDSTGAKVPDEGRFSQVGWLPSPCPPRRLLEEILYLTTPERSRPGFAHERLARRESGRGSSGRGPLGWLGVRTGVAERLGRRHAEPEVQP